MSSYDDKFQLFDEQIKEIEKEYPGLNYRKIDSILVLEGKIEFDLTCKTTGKNLSDSYLIRMSFPPDYPNAHPMVEEIGGKIPSNFHRNGKYLCLDVPSKVHMIFKENPTIKHFIQALLEPYLYSHTYWQKFNRKMPFGQWSHYGDGIFEHYLEYFNIEDRATVINFLELLVKKDYKQSMPCPCGSKKKIKKCHGKKLLNIYNNVPTDIIRYELGQILKTTYGIKFPQG